MRVAFVAFLALLLSACVTGQQVRQIGLGMSRAEVVQIMGAPDGVEAQGNTEVLKYSNRLMSGWSWDTTDYYVTFVDGRVTGYGNGQVRQNAPPTFPAYVPNATPAPSSIQPSAGVMCMKVREWTTGMTKQCAYNCLGNQVIQTISAVELCPLSISR